MFEQCIWCNQCPTHNMGNIALGDAWSWFWWIAPWGTSEHLLNINLGAFFEKNYGLNSGRWAAAGWPSLNGRYFKDSVSYSNTTLIFFEYCASFSLNNCTLIYTL